MVHLVPTSRAHLPRGRVQGAISPPEIAISLFAMPPRAAQVPTLHFHGHARMAQIDCVANQEFCLKNHIRARHNNNTSAAWPTRRDRHLPHLAGAYPTLRMYKDGDPINFELFTGQRTVDDVLKFIQQQMLLYKSK